MRRVASCAAALSIVACGHHPKLAAPVANIQVQPTTPLDGVSPEFAIVRDGKVLVDEHPAALTFTDVTLWAGQPPERDTSCDDDPPDGETSSSRYHECWDNGPNFSTLRGASATVAATERPELRSLWRNRAVTVYDETGPICQGHTVGDLTAWGSVFASVGRLIGTSTKAGPVDLARDVLAIHSSLFTTLDAPCAARALFVRDASLPTLSMWSLQPADDVNQERAVVSITVESPTIQLVIPPKATQFMVLIAGGQGEVNCTKVIQGAIWHVPSALDPVSNDLVPLYTAIPEPFNGLGNYQNGDAIGPLAVVDPRDSGWPVIISSSAIYRYDGKKYERVVLAELDYDRNPVVCGD